MNKYAQAGFLTGFLVLIIIGLLFFGGVGSSMQKTIRAVNAESTYDLGLWGYVTNNFVLIFSIFYVIAFIAVMAFGLGGTQQ
jgi:hypothetical protein